MNEIKLPAFAELHIRLRNDKSHSAALMDRLNSRMHMYKRDTAGRNRDKITPDGDRTGNVSTPDKGQGA
jgi:hypothetical protein